MADRLFQRFDDKELEFAFQVHQAQRAIAVIYWVISGGIAALIFFATLDTWSRGVDVAMIARWSLLVPLGGIALWIRKSPASFLAHYQRSMALLALVTVISSLVSLAMASPDLYATVKNSMLLTLIGLLTLLRLQLVHALVIGATAIIGYVAVAQGQQLLWSFLVHDLSILTVGSLVGAGINWLLESEARAGFVLTHNLRGKVREAEEAQNLLAAEVNQHRSTLSQLEGARQQAERASQAKSDFLAAVSHELRTPMNGMAGAIQLLDATELNAEQTQYQEVLVSSAQNLSLLLDDLFDLTRIEVGLLRIEPMPTNLHGLLNQLLSNNQRSADEQQLDLRFVWDESSLPRWVLLDAKRMTQILANLIQNALKFTHRGWVELSVSYDDQWLYFSISDTGKGLPVDINTVFQKYHQEGGEQGGLGLGLSICQMLAGHMGGEISAHRRQPNGAEFRVIMPLLRASEPSASKNLELVAHAHRVNVQVLLVEDNPINQKVARWSLEQLGCNVLVAADGTSALSQLQSTAIDLVFMDCEMQGMTGYQVTQTIRQTEDSMCHLPIIALTAHATSGARERCLAAGMDDYLAKPFRKGDLQRILERWLPA